MNAVKKFNELLSESLTLTNDKSLKLVTGKKDGYTFIIMPSDLNATTYSLIFSVSTEKGPVNDDTIKDIRKKSSKIVQIRREGNYGIAMTIKTAIKIKNYIENFRITIEEVTKYFKNNNILNADGFSGEIGDTFAINYKGKAQIVNQKTFDTIKREDGIKESIPVKENIPLGILGAILGSLVGVVVIIIFGQLGFISAMSGAVMGFATFYGYRKLGKKLDIKGIVLSILIMIIMIYIGARLDYAISIKRVVKDAELYYVFKSIPALIKEGVLDGEAYYTNIVLIYIFSIIGGIGSIRAAILENKNENVFRKIGE